MCSNVGEGSEDQKAFRTQDELTFGDLLRGETEEQNMNIYMWITTRKQDSNINAFQQSGAVWIEMMQFCENEDKECTVRVYLHYNKIDNTGRNKQWASNEEAKITAYSKGYNAGKKTEVQNEEEEKESLV